MPATTSLFRKVPKPHLFAHRGGNQAGSVENTKKAFSTASQLGYKFLETDIIVTKDQKVICYHGAQNRLLSRFSGLEVRRKLQELDYSQILQKAATDDERMPLLEDVLNEFPDKCFSIDVKTKEVIKPAVEVIKRLRAEDRVIITSFSLARSLKANRLLRGGNPEAALCLSRISLWTITPFNFFALYYLKLRGVAYLEVSYHRISRTLLRIATHHRMLVYAWTVNDNHNMRRMHAMGVDGIMSDEAELLLKTIKNPKA